jgi:PAS domain S-box-containing protein
MRRNAGRTAGWRVSALTGGRASERYIEHGVAGPKRTNDLMSGRSKNSRMIECMPVAVAIAFANALLDPVVVSAPGGRLLAINPALAELLGYSTKEAERLDLAQLMPEHRRREQEIRLQACLQGQKIIAVPSELRHRDARLIPVLLTMSLLQQEDGPEPLVIWTFKNTPAEDHSIERLNQILEDRVESRERALHQTVAALQDEVNQRRGMEKQLRLSRKQLRLLSRKTLELLESDRQLIARELHDSIGASLAAIKFSLEGWLEVYGHGLPSPEIPFEDIIAHIVETIKETKRISANLRPTTLDDLGLLATARWFCRNLAGLYTGIRIMPRFTVEEADIPEALKIVLYRVMQEALSNAAKHSGAEDIRVGLGLRRGSLEMTIADEGCGFDLEKVMGSEDGLSGFGINSMRERIEICNGSFDIRTRIGEGTRIRVLLPLPAQTPGMEALHGTISSGNDG